MNNAEFMARLRTLGWDNTNLAHHLGVQRSSVQRWCNGAYTLPEHIAEWVKDLSDAHAAGEVDRYNQLLAALPNGWQGKADVRNNRYPTRAGH
jgi:predicted transcriptional regulator